MSTAGGTRIAKALGAHRAVILRNHGLLTVGKRVDAAVGSFVLMERVAEVHMKARAACPISPASARLARDDLNRLQSARGAFWPMVERHIGDPRTLEMRR